MKPAADKLAVALQDITFNAPQVPVVNNVDVRAENDPEAIRSALVRQLQPGALDRERRIYRSTGSDVAAGSGAGQSADRSD